MLTPSQKRVWLIAFLILSMFILAQKERIYVILLDLNGFASEFEKLFVVISTAAIAFFTFTLWRATTGLFETAQQQAVDMKESLTIAKQSLIANDRAWIKIERAGISAPLTFTADTGHGQTALTLILKNIGRSPALNVQPSVFVVINPRTLPFPEPFAAGICQSISQTLKRRDINNGCVIFPGDSLTVTVGVTIPKNDIDQWNNWLLEKGITDGGVLGKITPNVVAIIDYLLPTDGEHHQTKLIYRLARRDPRDPNVPWAIDTNTPTTLADELALIDDSMGGGAAD